VVVAVKRRRLILKSDKCPILHNFYRCKKLGDRGALLRKERVRSSILINWRKRFARADHAARGAVRRSAKINSGDGPEST